MKPVLSLVFLFCALTGIAQDQKLEWAHLLGGTGADRGEDISVDRNGNIYTVGPFSGTVDFDFGTGVSNLSSSGTATYVQKLDSSGQLIWAKSLDGSALTWPTSVLVDDSLNVYLTGFFRGTTDFDPNAGTFNLTANGMDDGFVQKMDSNGVLLWAYHLGAGSNDDVNDISMDAAGNLYVTGTFNGTVDFDPGAGQVNRSGPGFFIQKISPSGQLIWVHTFGGPGTGSEANCIAADRNGSIYCAGSFYGTIDFHPDTALTVNLSAGASTSRDAFILRLDTTGNYIWVNGLGSNSRDAARIEGLHIHSWNSIYVSGRFSGSIDFDPSAGSKILSAFAGDDFFIQKVNSVGQEQWTHAFGRWNNDYGNDITTDRSGNVYTTGFAASSFDFDPDTGVFQVSVDDDAFIQQLDSNGQFNWVKLFQGSSSSDYTFGKSIFVDPKGNVYCTGEMRNSCDFDPGNGQLNLSSSNGSIDAYIVKLNLCSNSLRRDSVIACSSYTWIDGITYTASTDSARFQQIAVNCDTSFFELKLTILPPIDTTVSQNGVVLTAMQANASYQWLDCGNNYSPITGETAQSFTASQNGMYAVEITQNQCKDTSECIAVVSVGINEEAPPVSQLKLFPNPAKGSTELDLYATQEQAIRIQILNQQLQMIQEVSFQVKKGQNQIDLDVHALSQGLYWVSVRGEGILKHAPLIVQP